MDAHSVLMSTFFDGEKRFEIPFFQRPYVWGEVEWERLIEDLEYLCESERGYFIGSVIIKKQDKPITETTTYTLIDGQQRFTTLAIFFKVLLLKNKDSDTFKQKFMIRPKGGNGEERTEPVIRHNFHDQKKFNQIMLLDELSDLEGDDQITKAYNYFLHKIDTTKLDFNTIFRGLQIVNIEVQNDENEQQIFDTINSLGVRLTTAELLKNTFYANGEIEDYTKNWYPLFESGDNKDYWDKEVVTGKNRKHAMIDVFFHTFLQMKIQDKGLNISSERKKIYSREEDLYESYKNFIKNYCSKDNGKSLLDEIIKYAKIFQSKISTELLEKDSDALTNKPGIERINALIFALENSTALPYILFVETNLSDDNLAEKNDLYECLEAYLMRRYIAPNVTTNSDSRIFERMIQEKVLSRDQLEQFIAEQEQDDNYRLPKDAIIDDAIHNNKYQNTKAERILYMLESRLRDERCGTTIKGINDYSLEHMLPQTWQKNWPTDDAEKRENKLKTMGNFAIITKKLNSSISNSDWKTKKDGKNGNDGLKQYAAGLETLFGALEKEVWDEDTIDERADKLYEKILEVWPRGNVDEYIIKNAEKKSIPVDLSKPDLCTNKNPLYFQFEGGEKIYVSSWKKAYVEILNSISESDPSLLRQYIGKSLNSDRDSARADIMEGKDIDQMRDGLKLNNGLCLETHLSAKDIVKKIDSVLKIYNYPEELLYIAML